MNRGAIHRGVRRALSAAALSSVWGCSSPDEEAGGCPTVPATCPITSLDCQDVIFRAAACERGQEGATPPPVRTITAAQFAGEMMAATTAPSDAELVWTKAFQMLGMLPANATLREAASASAQDNVVAYYDPESQQVTVIDRDDPADPVGDIIVLAHEFTHALQDQDLGLLEYMASRVTSLDADVAIKSLIEGEATVLAVAVAARSQGRTPADVAWATASMSMWNSFYQRVGESTAPVITTAGLLPYSLGTDYIAPRWLSGGQEVIDEIYVNPPPSVLDWVRQVDPGDSLAVPLRCYPTTPPAGFTTFDKDTLGMSGMTAARIIARDEPLVAWLGSDGWRGDSLVVSKSDTSADVAVAWSVRWVSRNSDEGEAQRILDHHSVMGTTFQTSLDYGEATLLVAPPMVDVAAWAAAMQCGTINDLPTSPATQTAPAAAALRHHLPRHHFR